MEVKPLLYLFCIFKVGDGAKIIFWEDRWLLATYVVVSFPRLYVVSMNPNIVVQNFLPMVWLP
jgi:hypothetical protein